MMAMRWPVLGRGIPHILFFLDSYLLYAESEYWGVVVGLRFGCRYRRFMEVSFMLSTPNLGGLILIKLYTSNLLILKVINNEGIISHQGTPDSHPTIVWEQRTKGVVYKVLKSAQNIAELGDFRPSVP
jgi:hypothetical protein